MMMTLLEYINADPDNLGLPAMAATGNHEGIAQAINHPRFEDGLYVSRELLEVFVVGQGILGVAKITAQNAEAPMQLRAACLSLEQVVTSKVFPQLLLDDPATIAMRGAFVQAGIMTQAQDDALVALGVRHVYSVADREKFDAVTAGTVSIALEGAE